jgi:4-cresol dehydrogenase (hydroxylating)
MLDLFFKKSLYTGHLIPKEITLGSTYFRMKSARPSPEKMDPCLDNCGIYWMGPIVPFDGVNVEAAISIIKETITQYGFEPAMTLQMITSRQIDIIVSIAFDRTILGEDKKAKACHDELLRKLIVEGFYPYRLGIQSQSLLPSPDDDYCFLIEKIKKALDPNDILAPGRYDSR